MLDLLLSIGLLRFRLMLARCLCIYHIGTSTEQRCLCHFTMHLSTLCRPREECGLPNFKSPFVLVGLQLTDLMMLKVEIHFKLGLWTLLLDPANNAMYGGCQYLIMGEDREQIMQVRC